MKSLVFILEIFTEQLTQFVQGPRDIVMTEVDRLLYLTLLQGCEGDRQLNNEGEGKMPF